MKNPRIYGHPPYTVALVHGGPGAGGEMAPVAHELSDEFGVLEPLQTATSLAGQRKELADQLSAATRLPVILVGFSWGAWLSTLVAARYPRLVQKLILVGSGPFEERYLPQIQATRLSRLSSQEGAEYLAILESLGQPDESGKASAAGIFARLGELAARADQYDPLPDPIPTPITPQPGLDNCEGNPFHGVLQEAQELRKTGQLLAAAASIECPVVALHGTYDPHPVAGVDLPLSNCLNDFRLICFEQCGHKPWIERHARERFYQILRAELHAG